MTREGCEAIILAYLQEIKKVYLQYNPDGDYLELCMIKSSHLDDSLVKVPGWRYMGNNKYYDAESTDFKKKVYISKFEESGTLDERTN